jgi:hypothetical protein
MFQSMHILIWAVGSTGRLTPQKMHFNDHRENPLEGGIKGLYWGMYLGDERKGVWKIDLWTFDSAVCRNRLMHNEGIRNRLTP